MRKDSPFSLPPRGRPKAGTKNGGIVSQQLKMSADQHACFGQSRATRVAHGHTDQAEQSNAIRTALDEYDQLVIALEAGNKELVFEDPATGERKVVLLTSLWPLMRRRLNE